MAGSKEVVESKPKEEKKLEDAIKPFSADNLQANMRVVHYCRTFMSIVAGAGAGVLGLTGLAGFLFYLLIMAATSLALLARARFGTAEYFSSWTQLAFDGVGQGAMSFVLFWTLAYDVVHIF